MLALLPLLTSLPLLPAATQSIDCDRNGVAEELRLADGAIALGDSGDVPLRFAPTSLTHSTGIAASSLPYCRIDLARTRGLGETVVFEWAGGHWRFWLRSPTGTSSDGDRSIALAIDKVGVSRWETTPEATRCDGQSNLFPQAFSPAEHRFVPVEQPFVRGPAIPATTPTAPGRASPAYRLTGVSAQLGVDASDDAGADRLTPPSELADERRDTLWRWRTLRGLAWLVARRTAGAAPLVAVELDLPERARPARVAILRDEQPPLVAVLPPRGATVRLPLPAGSQPACVSLIFDAGDAASGQLVELGVAGMRLVDGGDSTTLGQLAEYTRGARGLATMVPLASAPDFAEALRQQLKTAARSDERRRLSELVVRLGTRLPAPLRCELLARSSDEERGLVAASLRGDPTAQGCLLALLTDPSQPLPTLREATRLLGTLGGAPIVQALCARTADAPLELAVAAGDALVAIVRRDPSLEATLAACHRTALPLIGYVVRRLPALGTALEARLSTELATIQQLPFDAAFLLLDAVAAHPLPGLAPTLHALLTADGLDETLAWRATIAIAAFDDPSSAALRQRLLDSALPRVRLAALAGIARWPAGGSTAPAIVRLLDDRWPEVQRQAARALGPLCPQAPTVRGVLERRLAGPGVSPGLGRELLSSYARCPGDSQPLLRTIVASTRHAPELRAQAVAELTRHPTPELPDELAQALERILDDPRADERQAELLLALTQALGRLGRSSTAVEQALALAMREPSLPELRAAAYESIAALCPPAGPTALERGLSDPSRDVAAAAKRGLQRCLPRR